MVIIAHRISTLTNCSQIIDFKDGEIQIIGSYSEISN